MVLESLITVENAEKKPWRMFFLGIVYSSVAILFFLWVFRNESSMIMITLTVFASFPLIYNTFKKEEEGEKEILEAVEIDAKISRLAKNKTRGLKIEKLIMQEHSKVLYLFLFLFLGFVFSFSIWYIALPKEVVTDVFYDQISTINDINSNVVGSAIRQDPLVQTFLNNLRVLLFSVLFSFAYGAGAIFILTWNASIIAAAIGNFVRYNLSNFAASSGLVTVGNYFQIISIGLIRYLPHSIFEVLAYFIGALAGGIISVAVINHDFYRKAFKSIIFDSLNLLGLSVLLLLIAAIMEVFLVNLF